jgi:tetratricopeptide (TPR) repeat protein
MLGPIYARKGQYAESLAAYAANNESPYVPPGQKGGRYKVMTTLSYQLKNWDNVVAYGNKAIEGGEGGDDVRQMIGQAFYLQGKCREASASMNDRIQRAEREGRRPEEQAMLLVRQCAEKSGDVAMQGRMLDKLLTYYPKPDYWALSINSLRKAAGPDDRLTLQIYRLMSDVGALKVAAHYGEMAQIANEQGFPGEAVSILEQAISKGVFTEQRDKERNTRFLDAARKLADGQKAALAKAEAEAIAAPTGTLLAAVGSGYLFNLGDAAKATSLLSQAVSKGSLKNANDTYITLGLAHWRMKNVAEAERAFAKVSKEDSYERLARFWALHVR